MQYFRITYPNMVTITPSLLYAFVVFLCMAVGISGQYAKFSKLDLPQGVTGPESAAFRGIIFPEGPFTTVTDGRILKWQGPNVGFVDFAYTSPTRTKQFCDTTTDPNKGPICGRPMALSFQPTTRLLYIADAYFGLLVVGPNGGLATQLAGGFKFATGVDVDLLTGNVYFIDASLTYDIRNTTQPGFMPDSTGRFLRYNPLTRRVSVLLSGLSGGGGPAVSQDGRFVLVPELTGNRISKYWLVGPRANQAELLLGNVRNPNKIKRAGRFGEFWVAVSLGFRPPTPLITPQGVRFNSNGVVLQTVSFATQFFNKTISTVQEQNGKLYVGSRLTNFIGVYSN
ncbi:putative strictosidine synthase [Helianthus annuus]|uniref:Strictosidine synthase n=1 Tax=Helianthus annuus TaxID=4232 RepID=A0A251TYU7_HELAN|nr:protein STRICTOSIDINE SYNTHASE-LIKE 12 [Helianthus annuus]KAF5792602.1 putative strictosidine synthase [Helianthus annuus]KAJ0536265.1 putative strictosidine synthase transcription factor WD40-like family [Helianthus annuus]